MYNPGQNSPTQVQPLAVVVACTLGTSFSVAVADKNGGVLGTLENGTNFLNYTLSSGGGPVIMAGDAPFTSRTGKGIGSGNEHKIEMTANIPDIGTNLDQPTGTYTETLVVTVAFN